MFSIGDKVVYPMHGAGTIESIEEQEMFGDTAEYYIIKMPVGDMKVMVPTESAEEIGVREVSDSSIAPSVCAVLEKPKEEYVYENNWNRRYKSNVEKIKTGDIIEFTNTSTLEKLKVKVDRIYKYENFEQLYGRCSTPPR